MKISSILAILLALISLSLPACDMLKSEEPSHQEQQKIVVTNPKAMDVILTQHYVCQIHAQRHIQVRALMGGYLLPIDVKEGQRVKKDEVLFSIKPILYKAKLAAEEAEVQYAQQDYNNTERLFKDSVVAQTQLALYKAKLEKAKAKRNLAKAELDFTEIRAPFEGIIDRLHEMQGSLIKEGDILTTLSDNSIMWVYFNVPEASYLEYKKSTEKEKAEQKVELELADGSTFQQAAISLRIEAKFNNENGNIAFRADFPNPDYLLRHGMTGNVLIHRTVHNAIVIPQRATYEILAKRYVYVVGKDNVVHPREIVVQNELPDIFVIKSGIGVSDKIVYEGVRQVRDGTNIAGYEFRPPEKILVNQKNHAE